jgi:hypothetical protein
MVLAGTRAGRGRRGQRRVPVPIAFAMVVAFATTPTAWAFSPFGPQPVLVIPLAHEHPGPPNCPAAAATQGPICPPYSPSDLQTMLQNGLDAWYPTETYGQTSWQVRVLGDPSTSDGWWPAPHTLTEYGATGNNNFTSAVAQVRDAGETILSQAIQGGVIDPFTVLSYQRFLVIDNWNHHLGAGDRAGQTNSVGIPLVYYPTIFQLPGLGGPTNVTAPFVTTASVVSVEVTSPSQIGVADFLSVVRHELGHQLGEPDLYSQSPCPLMPPGAPAEIYGGDASDCVGPWDHMALDYEDYPGFGAFNRMNLGWLDPDPLGTAVRYIDKAFSGTIALDPLEQPQGAPVAIAVPADLGGVALARFFGITGPFKGFLIECRKRLGDDLQIPAEGVLVSFIDPTRGNDHPEDTARGASGNTASTAILSSPPLSSYANSAYGFTVRYAGSTANGGCNVALNAPFASAVAHLVPAVSWLSGTTGQLGGFGGTVSHSAFAGQGVTVNGPAPAGAATGAMPITPFHAGGVAHVRFAYGNAGTAPSTGGVATVTLTEPYTVSACGPQPTGRRVGHVRLASLAAGQAATAQLAFHPRTSGSIGVMVDLPAGGPGPLQTGGVEGAVLAFQTHRQHRNGRSAARSVTVIVTSARTCPGPVSLSLSPLVLPTGWSVTARGLDTSLLPGEHRRVVVRIQAPKGALAQALDIPVALLAAPDAPAIGSGMRSPSFFRDQSTLIGGLDVLARVALPGHAVPPFVLPPPPPPTSAQPYPPAPPLGQMSTLTVTCSGGGPAGATVTTVGMLSPAEPAATIQVTYTDGRGASTTHVVTTDLQGGFSDSFAPAIGQYTVEATWAGDGRLRATTSNVCQFGIG